MKKLIGYICINLIRKEATKECILSIEKYCPFIQVYVADQDAPTDDMINFYKEHQVKYYFVERDCGIGVARNFLIDKIEEPYLMWGDNDFLFNDDNNHLTAIDLLTSNRKIGFVGGSLSQRGKFKHYERELFYDRQKGLLVYVPLDLTEPIEYKFKNLPYYFTDLTFNYVLTRTNALVKNKKLRWNEELKVRFEHTDFFLKIKLYCNRKVVYFPAMTVVHNHVSTPYYHQFRHRAICGEVFGKAWNLKMAIGIDGTKLKFDSLKTTNIHKIENAILIDNSALSINEPSVSISSKSLPKEPITSISLSDIPNIGKNSSRDIIKHLLNNQIDFWLLKDSCYSAVCKHNLDIDKLYLGVSNDITKQAILKLSINIPIEIIIEPNRQTKIITIEDYGIKVPYPVVRYLENYLGKSWKQLQNE